jgi:hypothetical protein
MKTKTWEVRWEGDLPGTPQQIWDAFTKHTAAYLWPITYEPRVGGAERGLNAKGGTVTAWEPQRHFRTEARGEHNVLDYRLDGSHLSYVHYGGAPEDEFDVQHDACVQHTKLYNHSMGEYVRHFAGREPHYLAFDEVPGSTEDVLARLGIAADAGVGDEVELGVVDYREPTMIGVRSASALIRVYGRDAWGWPVGVSIHSFDGPADEAAWRKRLEVA